MLTINNTLDGYLKDVEIKGNTIQDSENLADIRSVGDAVEGQELYEIPVLSVGKNLAKPCKLLNYMLQEPNIKDEERRYATEELIRIKSGTNYRFSTKNNTTTKYVIWLDSNKNFISRSGVGSSNKVFEVQSPSNAKYCQLYVYDGSNTLNRETEMLTNEWQLEEGTVATPYEPYQEDKLTILSPVQLEKVGDVADRIIEKDGVWGVEKNIVTELVLGNSWIQLAFDDVIMFGTSSNYKMSKEFGISNYFIYEGSDTNTEHFKYDIKNNKIYTYIKKSKLSTENGVGFLKWSKENGYYHKFATTQPTFIPLPHDQQVKLRTFASKTNISFLTEIEGTIKAQVPKSLGATVNTHTEQINNLNNELNRVKKLEESTVSTVATESDFTTVEATSNGYFEDVKLEGKTLVNELGKSGSSIVQNFPNNKSIVWNKNNIKLNTFYTLVVDCKTNNASADIKLSAYELNQSNNATIMTGSFNNDTVIFKVGKVGRYITKVGYTSLDLTKDSPRITIFNGESGTATYDIMLLEGDHTQNPPSYFEGLKSVGQSASEDGVDEIVVSSVNENLLEFDSAFTSEVGSWDDANLSSGVAHNVSLSSNLCKVTIANNSNYHFLAFKTIIKKGVSYSYKFDSTSILGNGVSLFKDLSSTRGQILGTNFSGTFVANDDYNYIALPINREVSTYSVSNFILTKNTQVTEYTPHQSDKKRLLYYNNETQTWEKPILREWDSIEKHADGKYYYHQRSGEIVLNGSEDWVGNYSFENTGRWVCTIPNIKENSSLVCDKFINKVNHSDGVESIFVPNPNKLYLTLSNDKGDPNTWLQTNNVTVVYQLAEEKVYECTNIDLITYANETNYVINSGAIIPRTTLKVHNNISNVVSLLQKKVSLLENNITSYMITQNRLMLSSRYNADTVSFKVDVATLRNSFEYDNDLYELILNNILVGKDNYNREYIENLIIFYWMDFVISDEMYSTLFEIIEEQHNPKIEEETPLI